MTKFVDPSVKFSKDEDANEIEDFLKSLGLE
jgi:hypothetical protein